MNKIVLKTASILTLSLAYMGNNAEASKHHRTFSQNTTHNKSQLISSPLRQSSHIIRVTDNKKPDDTTSNIETAPRILGMMDFTPGELSLTNSYNASTDKKHPFVPTKARCKTIILKKESSNEDDLSSDTAILSEFEESEDLNTKTTYKRRYDQVKYEITDGGDITETLIPAENNYSSDLDSSKIPARNINPKERIENIKLSNGESTEVMHLEDSAIIESTEPETINRKTDSHVTFLDNNVNRPSMNTQICMVCMDSVRLPNINEIQLDTQNQQQQIEKKLNKSMMISVRLQQGNNLLTKNNHKKNPDTPYQSEYHNLDELDEFESVTLSSDDEK